MKDRYIFPAVFYEDENGIAVEFPDLPGCFTCGTDIEEALDMAKDALGLHIYGMEQDGESIPAPSKVTDLKAQLDDNQFIALVEVWMPVIRGEAEAMKSVKKTLTIPKWLNDLGEKHKVNFSQLLQEALKVYLGVSAVGARLKDTSVTTEGIAPTLDTRPYQDGSGNFGVLIGDEMQGRRGLVLNELVNDGPLAGALKEPAPEDFLLTNRYVAGRKSKPHETFVDVEGKKRAR